MNIPFLIYFLCLLLVLADSIRRGREVVNLFPSLVWGFQMVLPFIIQKSLFSPDYAPVQGTGLLAIGFSLLLADLLSLTRRVNIKESVPAFEKLGIGYVLMGIVLLLQLSHLYLMPRIPLFEEWFGASSGRELKMMREMASKYLSVPRPYIYLCQATVNVLAPLGVALLFRHRKYLLSGILFFSTLVYSMATLAKSPAWIFVSLCALLLYAGMEKGPRKKAFIAVSVVLMAGIFFFGRFLITNPWSVLNWRLEPKQLKSEIAKRSAWAGPKMPKIFTMCDHYRIHFIVGGQYPLEGMQRRFNHYAYYLFLAPVDVAQWWYVYYPDVNGSYLGLEGLTSSSRSKPGYIHPANRVGKWAFFKRFPLTYLESNHSYAGVDADAHARWGWKGWVAVSVLLFLVRIGLSVFRVGGSLSASMSYAGIFLLALTMPHASLQALLVSQGVLLYLVLMSCMYIYGRIMGVRTA
jgi:hypothetical protein